MNILARSLVWLCHATVFHVLKLLQSVLWRLNGVQAHLRKITHDDEQEQRDYSKSAQVLSICWAYRLTEFDLIKRSSFVALHNYFDHPRCVLSSQISLLALDKERAFFVEVPAEYDVYDTEKNPFTYHGQFSHAVRLILMPLQSLEKLAEEIEEPRCNVVWLHSTGRCGSTAVAQVFNALPNSITLSEPQPIVAYMQHCSPAKSDIATFCASSKYKRLYKAAIVAMLKEGNTRQLDSVLVKTQPLSGVCDIELLNELFPQHHQLYLYRDCVKTVSSQCKTFQDYPIFRCMDLALTSRFSSWFSGFFGMLTQASRGGINENPPWKEEGKSAWNSLFALFVDMWTFMNNEYTKHYQLGRIRCIQYELLVQERHSVLQAMFKYCDLPLEYLDRAASALDKDSQEHSNISQQKNVHRTFTVSESAKTQANIILVTRGYPKIGEQCMLDGMLR